MQRRFFGNKDYVHGLTESIGVLLVNLGTPSAPTPSAVRRYLRQFLSDTRVIEQPRWLWWLILRGFILPFRPRRVATLYEKIWTTEGSPLLHISRQQQAALQQALSSVPVRVELGMSYGEPSIAKALRQLDSKNCRRLLILPLYPQYAGSTTGAVFDGVVAELSRWRAVPHLHFVAHYCDDQRYIRALTHSITRYQQQHGTADRLIFSFHGTPREMLLAGDPYHCLCHKTARLVAQQLGLASSDWMVTFQSRFGPSTWLQPYTDETLRSLPRQGIKRLQIICPAFSVDCLETLEEIEQENRHIFRQAGGESYGYIPALNADSDHIHFLRDLIMEEIDVWLQALTHHDSERCIQSQAYARESPNRLP